MSGYILQGARPRASTCDANQGSFGLRAHCGDSCVWQWQSGSSFRSAVTGTGVKAEPSGESPGAHAAAEIDAAFGTGASLLVLRTHRLLGDTNALTPEEHGHRFREFRGFTNLQNATGAPAISLPQHRNADGLPIGVQFAAAPGEELLLLQLARTLEAAARWPTVVATGTVAPVGASAT